MGIGFHSKRCMCEIKHIYPAAFSPNQAIAAAGSKQFDSNRFAQLTADA